MPRSKASNVPNDSSDTSIQFHIQAAYLSAEQVVKGFRTAPDLSPSAPCLFLLPFYFDDFFKAVQTVSFSRGITPASYMRAKHGEVLDAMVAFANATWTEEQIEKFMSCRCKRHQKEDIDGKLEIYVGFTDGRGKSRNLKSLHALVSSCFLIVADVAMELKQNEADAIRLERDPNKRGKWPSTPSKFIPNGASATLSAFMAWARLVEDPSPLRALSNLVFCCPSLGVEMIRRGAEILRVVDTVLSRYIESLKALKPEEVNHYCDVALRWDILPFTDFFEGEWFRYQTVNGPTNSNPAIIFPIVCIYGTLCTFMNYPFPSSHHKVKDVKERLGLIGAVIYYMLTATADVSRLPLHPDFAPYLPSIERKGPITSGFGLASAALSLRNQGKCTSFPCNLTSEVTKTNFKMCAACRAVRYCSKECQQADWKWHKQACKALKVLVPLSDWYVKNQPPRSLPTAIEEHVAHFMARLKEEGLADDSINYAAEYIFSRGMHPLTFERALPEPDQNSVVEHVVMKVPMSIEEHLPPSSRPSQS